MESESDIQFDGVQGRFETIDIHPSLQSRTILFRGLKKVIVSRLIWIHYLTSPLTVSVLIVLDTNHEKKKDRDTIHFVWFCICAIFGFA
mmetsp:Transcript_3327/g.6231  ORF Transcript_3327/g.6231 Transcript_3327/m.6231 type:complete len:89 (+) Transcript_3327:65-331(+)